MGQGLRHEHINRPPSAPELLIFPELNDLKIDGSEDLEFNINKILNLDTNYSIPLLDYTGFIQNPRIKTVKINIKKKSYALEKAANRRNKKQYFLYYLYIRLLWNFSLMANHKKFALKIKILPDSYIDNLINNSEDVLTFKFLDLTAYIQNLKNLERVIKKISGSFTLFTILNKPHLINNNKAIYPQHFYRIKTNYLNKLTVAKLDWASGSYFRRKTKYTEFKVNYYKTKIEAILKDKLLINNLIKSYYFTTPKKARRRRNIKAIYLFVRRKKIFILVNRILKQLILRRHLLWLNIKLKIVRKARFHIIGKDYRIYRKRIGRTYLSQHNKYLVSFKKKKRLNAKFIKCLEYRFNRSLLKEIKEVIHKIYKINKYLHYFLNRFPKLLKYKSRVYDPHFVIPLNSKLATFDEVLEKISSGTRKIKNKIFTTIIFCLKHSFEKHLLFHLQKRKQRSLDYYINILEKEKYYAKHRKTRFEPRLKKWLMKYVNEELNSEFCEYFSRPRVVLEKREAELDKTLPYLPAVPLVFQRDLDLQAFKKQKRTKFHIIRLTKPWIILQSQFFKYKGLNHASKNLLRTKFGAKLSIPERVQRIKRFCNQFYTNFIKDHSYSSFINFIIKLKVLFLIKPELKNNPKYYMIYILSIIVSPLFRGITEEREYADQLHKFLSSYLIRIRTFRHYDSTRLVQDLKSGYVKPKPRNLKLLRKIFFKTKSIIQKRPNYTAIRFMHRRSLKRLTVRIRSKIAVSRGLLPLFKYNLMATSFCSPINLKKNLKHKGYHYLFQPDVDKKARAKYRYYLSALKRTYGYSTTFHTNARLYYFSPYNVFLNTIKADYIEENSINKNLINI